MLTNSSDANLHSAVKSTPARPEGRRTPEPLQGFHRSQLFRRGLGRIAVIPRRQVFLSGLWLGVFILEDQIPGSP